MLAIRSLTLLALAAFASAQTLEGVDPCGQDCYTQALNNAGAHGCAAMDMNCLCRVEPWHFAIRDCAEAGCPPGYMPTVTAAAAALCATATLPPGVPVPTEPTTQAPPPPTTTQAPAPTTESPEEVVPSTSSTTLETSTTSAPETSSTSETSASSTTSAPGAATKVETGTGTSSADASAATSEVPAAASDSAGLTEAAKIGIGVGVGAAVIAAAAVVACLLLRKRRESQGPPPGGIDRFKISHPMPSDEHAYTHNNNSEYDIGGGDLEMKSRRYEDMLPREEPRQMV